MIKIAERLHPFSHIPGTTCLIPGTSKCVEAFPTLVRVKELDGTILKEIELEVDDPLSGFTLMQDLEKGYVTVWSHSYRLHLLPPDGEVVFRKSVSLTSAISQERLGLGCHKKQEWEAIKRRLDFREIFPLWLRLGSFYSLPERPGPDAGIFSLLKECREAIFHHRPEWIVPAFKRLFLASFKQLFVPRSHDEDFQGILNNSSQSEDSLLYLLTEGAQLIRSLFIASSGNEIFILPNLPPECFFGRMTRVSCLPYGEIDLEWTKKMIRKIVFRSFKEGEVNFHFHSSIRSFRLRYSRQDHGIRLSCGEPVEIKSGSIYLLDQFQK